MPSPLLYAVGHTDPPWKETAQGQKYQKIGTPGSHRSGWLSHPYSLPPITRISVDIWRFPNLLFLLLQFYQRTQKSTAAMELVRPHWKNLLAGLKRNLGRGTNCQSLSMGHLCPEDGLSGLWPQKFWQTSCSCYLTITSLLLFFQ